MTDNEVFSAVVEWLNGLTDLTVIKAYGGVEPPPLPYIMVNYLTMREVREHAQQDNFIPPRTLASSTYATASDDDLTASLVLQDAALGDITASPIIETEWQFSVHCYGVPRIDPKTNELVIPAPAAPTDILRPIRSAAQLAQMNEPLMPGLVVHQLSAIRNVPDFNGARWEPRAQMDLFIRGLVADGFVVDTIDAYSFDFERI